MSNKTVTFLRETRVDQIYAEGATASFDADTAAALIEQGYAVAGRQEVAEPEALAPAPAPPPAPAPAPTVRTAPAPAPPAKGKARG